MAVYFHHIYYNIVELKMTYKSDTIEEGKISILSIRKGGK